MRQPERRYGQNEIRVKKYWPKSRSKNFRACYYWGKFLGVNPLSLSKKDQLEYSYVSLLYGCLLSIIYFYVYYCALVERLRVLLPGETPIAIIVDFLGISCQFLETSLTWFVFAVYQNRMKIIVKSFVRAERTAEKLGIPDDCDKHFKEFGVNLTLHNIIYLVSLVASNIMWSFFTNFDLFVWSRFNFPPIASFNAAIIFTCCLILVRRKFRRINETLLSLMQNGCAKANEVDEGSSGLTTESRCDTNLLLDRVNLVSQLHRELRGVIYRIEGHFAPFLLFSIANSFNYITLNFYNVYRYLKIHPRDYTDLLYVGATSHWVFYPVAWLVVMSIICGSTSDEANNTGNMLHKLLTRCDHFRDIRVADKLNSLSLDLLKNQVSMSVFGLFKLDNFLVYRTIVAATSYLNIMLQLYN